VSESKYCFRKEPILEYIDRRLKDTRGFAELEDGFKRFSNANQRIDPVSRLNHSPLRTADS
jgi:hypothetical protein